MKITRYKYYFTIYN